MLSLTQHVMAWKELFFKKKETHQVRRMNYIQIPTFRNCFFWGWKINGSKKKKWQKSSSTSDTGQTLYRITMRQNSFAVEYFFSYFSFFPISSFSHVIFWNRGKEWTTHSTIDIYIFLHFSPDGVYYFLTMFMYSI